MKNEEKVLEMFCKQFPQYEKDKANLGVNLYGDIINSSTQERKIIAVSDLPHDLMEVGYMLPTSWKLED